MNKLIKVLKFFFSNEREIAPGVFGWVELFLRTEIRQKANDHLNLKNI
jgi:hypothetical protein